jgi:hypothetical protein
MYMCLVGSTAVVCRTARREAACGGSPSSDRVRAAPDQLPRGQHSSGGGGGGPGNNGGLPGGRGGGGGRERCGCAPRGLRVERAKVCRLCRPRGSGCRRALGGGWRRARTRNCLLCRVMVASRVMDARRRCDAVRLRLRCPHGCTVPLPPPPRPLATHTHTDVRTAVSSLLWQSQAVVDVSRLVQHTRTHTHTHTHTHTLGAPGCGACAACALLLLLLLPAGPASSATKAHTAVLAAPSCSNACCLR